MARVTLTMIVKNEAERLPDALRSVAEAVDEIVIVDTGSTDDTVTIARNAGAIVVHHPFDDFASARNAGLPAVTGEWMLVLDADERLAPGGAAVIRAAVAANALDCGMLSYHNATTLSADAPAVLSGAARRGVPVMIARLFRNTSDFRWEGAAHETPRAWLSAPGRRILDLDAALIHYGSAVELIATKGPRNLPLLQRRVDADPADCFGRVYLARELLRAERAEDAREQLEAAWRMVSADHRQRGEIVTLVTLRTLQQIASQDLSGAWATLMTAADWGAAHPNLALLRGTVQEQIAAGLAGAKRAASLEAAIVSLRCCPDFAGHRLVEEVIPGAMTWAVQTRLGSCYQALGQEDAARAAFQTAFQGNPALQEARLGLAEAIVETDPERSLRLLEPILAEAGVDGWLLKSAAHEVRGEDHDMARALMQGLQHIREGFSAPHRRALMDELVSLIGILQGAPRPGRGAIGALSGLMSGYPPSAGACFPAPPGSPTARRLEKIIAYLRLRGEQQLLAALAGPPMEALFPGIGWLLRANG
ncbi:MAG: glycosyltransferase [Myxococcota bacterium]|nr:glycosyltransferase [Myxococcota bacterium]